MDFVLKKCGKQIFIDVNQKILDTNIINSIFKKLKKRNFIIDCTNVEGFENSKTVELICSLNISIINAASNLITQASILGQNNFPKFYIDLEDCINNKRLLIRRRFKIV